MNREESLEGILEAVDLVSMVEGLAFGNGDGLLHSIAGVRLTLGNVREKLLRIHSALDRPIVSRPTEIIDSEPPRPSMPSYSSSPSRGIRISKESSPVVSRGATSPAFKRQDFRAEADDRN